MGSIRLEGRIFSILDFKLEAQAKIKGRQVHKTAAHRAFGDTLLPLAHSDTLFQGGAFLQQQVPTTVWVSGSNTGSAGTNQVHFYKNTGTPVL